MNTQTNPIFIIDDDEVYAKSLKAFIQNSFPSVKEVKTFSIGEMSLMELQLNPSVIIIDYFLNSKYPEAHNGLEIMKQIKKTKPNTKIIILSAQDSPDVILEVIRDYNSTYVQKDKDSNKQIKYIIEEFINQKKYSVLDPWS